MALADCDRDSRGWFGPACAGSVIAPVACAACFIDEGELELSCSVEVNTINRNAALVIENPWRIDSQGGSDDAKEKES